MKRCMLLLAVVGAMAISGRALGQGTSTYAQNQLNGIYARNSTQVFTTDRVRANLFNRTVPQYGYSQVNRGLFNNSLSTRAPQKPFTGAGGGGSVSPWLALSDPFTSSAHNYYTQVRPQLEQQRLNQQMAARNMQMQRQLNQMAAQPPYDPGGNENMAPTGHAAAYLNYGGYYQPVQPTKGQR
jgi:hypothetical protein